MGLQASDSAVYKLLSEKMYSVPSNQRKYVWKANNWSELLDDIKLILKERGPHFIGSVVLKEEKIDDGIKEHYSIIDGQQRISTLTIAICAIGFIFAELKAKGEFCALTRYLQVKDNKNNPHPIVSKEANKDIANMVTILCEQGLILLDSGMPMISTKQFLDLLSIKNKTITDCFIYFYKEFSGLSNNNVEELEKILKVITDMKYIDIIAQSDEDAFTIFEILNARGQPLKDFDLLRNYLLKYCKKQAKSVTKKALDALEEVFGTTLEVFLKHYVMHKYGKKSDRDENRPYKIIVAQEKLNDKLAFIEDLLAKAQYYQKITTLDKCSLVEKKVFSFFKSRRQQQFRPIVLGLMHQKDLGNLTEENYTRALMFLYEFFIYYNVIGEQNSNKIEDVVQKYSGKIENEFTDALIEEMKKSMAKRIPNEESFYTSIQNVRYSSSHWLAYKDSKKSENARIIFDILERELGYTDDLSSNSMHVEHILPDADTENNTIIGNMMLLEAALEDACKNKPLVQKIELYKQSKLKLPQLIVELYQKGEELDIMQRTKWIADTLYSYIKKLKED